MKNFIKLGHQSPKGFKVNRFNFINIDGDLHYCKSHNFVYNDEEEREKLYNGQPCFYTDKRFVDGDHNYFKECYLYWNRRKQISLRSCVRRVLNCRNIPIGTKITSEHDWYIPGKKIDTRYVFKVKKDNPFDPKYQINMDEYFNNFNTCEFSRKLTEELRKNGFIVKVFNKNPDFLVGEEEGGEIAFVHGYGKQIGFSSGNYTFRGYSNGCDNILWDKLGEFNKWSRCNEIPKTTDISEIIDILKNE